MGADMQAGQTLGESVRGPERVLRGSLELPYDRPRLHDAIHAAAADAHVMVSRSDPEAGVIEGRLPTTLFVWSPTISLQVEDSSEGQTRVSYEVRGLERRPNSEQQILSDTRDRLALLLRGAAKILEEQKVPS